MFDNNNNNNNDESENTSRSSYSSSSSSSFSVHGGFNIRGISVYDFVNLSSDDSVEAFLNRKRILDGPSLFFEGEEEEEEEEEVGEEEEKQEEKKENK